jgi:hypothetical protein
MTTSSSRSPIGVLDSGSGSLTWNGCGARSAVISYLTKSLRNPGAAVRVRTAEGPPRMRPETAKALLENKFPTIRDLCA